MNKRIPAAVWILIAMVVGILIGYMIFTQLPNGADLPPANRASRSLVKFVFGEEDEHEEALYGTANHRVSEGSRGR
ncbi:hypothetical protein, partial [Burkholderia multivorans]|uniref:hypothetical protein n=1 Tax=Burkholderia multivorans TaxID=87883 RepID=UPI001C246545